MGNMHENKSRFTFLLHNYNDFSVQGLTFRPPLFSFHSFLFPVLALKPPGLRRLYTDTIFGLSFQLFLINLSPQRRQVTLILPLPRGTLITFLQEGHLKKRYSFLCSKRVRRTPRLFLSFAVMRR